MKNGEEQKQNQEREHENLP